MPLQKSSLYFTIPQIFFEKEQERFAALLNRKAKYLKALKDKDLFSLPEAEALRLQKLINALTEELEIMNGFRLLAIDMKTGYEDGIDKTYNAYHNLNANLEMQLHQARQLNSELQAMYCAALDTVTLFTDLAIKKTEEIIELKKTIKNDLR